MKKLAFIFVSLLIVSSITGCRARFQNRTVLDPAEVSAAVKEMALADAKRTVEDALANTPAGRRPKNPGFEHIGKYTRRIILHDHTRTGYCLVELQNDKRAYLKFYVINREAGKKFAAAVQRLTKEYKR